MERVTTKLITYCFLDHWNKPAFVRAHRTVLGNRYKPDLPPALYGPVPVIEHDVWIGQDA